MVKLIAKYKWTLIGGVVGSAAGYAYYYFVGCNSGSCAITSNPVNSTVYGILMGGLLFNMFESGTNKK